MPDPNPQCPANPEDCRITYFSAIAEPIKEWTPIYDGNGALVNSDPNTQVHRAYCEICDMAWDTLTGPEGRRVANVRKLAGLRPTKQEPNE